MHISACPQGQSRPKLDELVTFEIAEGEKGAQAYNVFYISRPRHVVRPTRLAQPESKRNYTSIFIMAIFGFLVLTMMAPKKSTIPESGGAVSEPVISPDTQSSQVFHCAGKSKCSEMNSCDEAVYYLKNCPGTIMDGDGDGLPCEDQWCGH